MLDPTGALHPIVSAHALGWSLAPLVVALGVHAARALRAKGPGGDAVVGLAAIGGTTGILLARAIILARRGGTPSVDVVTGALRVGAADVSLTLALDPLGAGLSLFACVLALAVAVWMAFRPMDGSAARWAWMELALGGALLSFLADGVVAQAVGWSVTAASSAWLSGWCDPRRGAVAATRGAAAVVALAMGYVGLYWGTAGTWDGRELTVEPAPRFVATRMAPEEAGAVTIRLARPVGAAVYLDDARSPLGTAPFSGPSLPYGFHVLRIRPGGVSAGSEEDAIVDVDVPQEGASIAIVPTGPSLVIRDTVAAIAMQQASGSSGRMPDARAIAGVLCAWVLAAWLLSAAPAVAGAPGPLATLAHGGTTALVGPVLLVRAMPLVTTAPALRLVLPVAMAAILVAAVAALWTAAAHRGDEASAWASFAPIPGAVLFERAPTVVGALLVRFERWVLDAVLGAAFGVVRLVAWAVARIDEGVIGAADRAAAERLAGAGHRIEGLVGAPLASLVWTVAAASLALAVAEALWAGR